MIFVTLVALTVTVISQAETETGDSPGELNEVCSALLESRIDPAVFGYENVKDSQLSDLCAASLMLKDGKALKYLSDTLNNLYPWQGSTAVALAYGGFSESSGTVYEVFSQHCEKEYIVGYGGKLTVSVYLYS